MKPADIKFSVHEVLGADIHPIPEGEEPPNKFLTDTNILTKGGDLKVGMRVLVPTLFGWGVGVISRDKDGNPSCHSPDGQVVYVLTFAFAKDRPPLAEGAPLQPRWICTGSGNLRGLNNLEIFKS